MVKKQETNMNKDEQVGFHKGALTTLAKERQEVGKILQIVEQLMQMHVKALKELGVDLEAQAKELQKSQKDVKLKGTDKPIDELI